MCPTRIHMLKPYPPVPQNVTVFEDRTFKGVIEVNEVDLIQYDRCPF